MQEIIRSWNLNFLCWHFDGHLDRLTEFAEWVLIGSHYFHGNENSDWLTFTVKLWWQCWWFFLHLFKSFSTQATLRRLLCLSKHQAWFISVVTHPYSDLHFSLKGVIIFHSFCFVDFPTFVPGSQQHPGAEGCKGHVLQPTVSPAIALQLPQVAAQGTAELPAPGLGDEDSP